jgi:hypothetical protein
MMSTESKLLVRPAIRPETSPMDGADHRGLVVVDVSVIFEPGLQLADIQGKKEGMLFICLVPAFRMACVAARAKKA